LSRVFERLGPTRSLRLDAKWLCTIEPGVQFKYLDIAEPLRTGVAERQVQLSLQH
jgi:hypothetical protein